MLYSFLRNAPFTVFNIILALRRHVGIVVIASAPYSPPHAFCAPSRKWVRISNRRAPLTIDDGRPRHV